jgi:hypothetical protein
MTFSTTWFCVAVLLLQRKAGPAPSIGGSPAVGTAGAVVGGVGLGAGVDAAALLPHVKLCTRRAAYYLPTGSGRCHAPASAPVSARLAAPQLQSASTELGIILQLQQQQPDQPIFSTHPPACTGSTTLARRACIASTTRLQRGRSWAHRRQERGAERERGTEGLQLSRQARPAARQPVPHRHSRLMMGLLVRLQQPGKGSRHGTPAALPPPPTCLKRSTWRGRPCWRRRRWSSRRTGPTWQPAVARMPLLRLQPAHACRLQAAAAAQNRLQNVQLRAGGGLRAAGAATLEPTSLMQPALGPGPVPGLLAEPAQRPGEVQGDPPAKVHWMSYLGDVHMQATH